jgi:tetratricopeptide (TPR) repeat protein
MTIAEKRLFNDAEKLFNEEKYSQALLNYSKILESNPYSRKAQMLVILTEMVMNKENGGEALYDYYTILLGEEIPNPEDVIQSILDSLDNKQLGLNKIFDEPLKEQLMYADGISYADFKEIAVKEKGFKRAFEDIVFTTKVIITNKGDLIDFLNNLIKYGFYSAALNYLESALSTFPNDKSLQFLADKLQIRAKA